MAEAANSSAVSSIAVLTSGGLDSCILVSHLLAAGRNVRPLYVACGLAWEQEELRHLRRYLARIAAPSLGDVVTFALPLADVYGRHWSVTGDGVPDDKTPDEAVYLPGRNLLLTAKPAVWCLINGVGELALATLAGNPFADASDAFFAALESALNRGASQQIQILRPFSKLTKQAVMNLGRGLPLDETFSCIRPIGGKHCGRCNKCAERKAAFAAAEMSDPTMYAG